MKAEARVKALREVWSFVESRSTVIGPSSRGALIAVLRQELEEAYALLGRENYNLDKEENPQPRRNV